ncbi:MAG: division/cell wall cluster transcriptional repressor MraZ [Arenicella sp.]
MLLIGNNNINLDTKGRLAVPTKYRPDLALACAGKMVLARSPRERCLWLYPLPVWEEIQAKIVAMPAGNKGAERYRHVLLGTAEVLEMDGSGRILIKENLRNMVGLKKETCLVGQGNKFEIWDHEEWGARFDEWLTESQDDSIEMSL